MYLVCYAYHAVSEHYKYTEFISNLRCYTVRNPAFSREASALAGHKVLRNRYLFDSNKYTHRCYNIVRVIS